MNKIQTKQYNQDHKINSSKVSPIRPSIYIYKDLSKYAYFNKNLPITMKSVQQDYLDDCLDMDNNNNNDPFNEKFKTYQS